MEIRDAKVHNVTNLVLNQKDPNIVRVFLYQKNDGRDMI